MDYISLGIKIGGILLSVISTLSLMGKDMRVTQSKRKGLNRWQQLTAKGKRNALFIILGGIIIVAGFIYDGQTKSIAKNTENSYIYICKTELYPIKYGKSIDTLYYRIEFCNNSKADAYNFNLGYYLYAENIDLIPGESKILRDYTLPVGAIFSTKNYILTVHGETIPDTLFLNLKGNYDNASKKVDELLLFEHKRSKITIAAIGYHDEFDRRLLK